MGADSPATKTVFLRAPRAIMCKGQRGLCASQGGKGAKCPKVKNSYFFAFSTNFRRNDFWFFFHMLDLARRSVDRKNFVKIWRPVFEKIAVKVPKNAKIAKFQMPISPPNGDRFPRNKNHFWQDPRCYNAIGQIGGPAPGSGKPPKVPQSQIDKIRVQKRITCKEETCQFSSTVTKYYPSSMIFVGRWTFWRRVWGPQSPEMGSKCQFWKIQTPTSPLNGGRFPLNKDHFSQGPQGYNMQGSDRGYVPRKGVKGQSAPKLKIRNFLRFRLTSDETIFDFFPCVRRCQSFRRL